MRRLTCPLPCLLLVLVLAAACSGDDDNNKPADAGAEATVSTEAGSDAPRDDLLVADAKDNPACKDTTPKVVKLDTDDGLKLEAELVLSGTSSSPAAVLLHMTPVGGNDRRNYPKAFIDALTQRGVTVLNVDRRGAGNSQGNAQDAFMGPKGKLDAKAAYDFLASHACPPDLSRIVYIGASNGTTTALDFAAFAAEETKVLPPKALVFLTAGGYTEAQNKIADQLTVLETTPLLWVYSNTETWSAQFKAGAPTGWVFKEYQGGDHGTLMFKAKPESVTDVAKFVADSLKK